MAAERDHRSRASRPWRALEGLLFSVGVLLLGYCGYVQLETYLYQRTENRALDRLLVPVDSRMEHALFAPPRPGEAFGRISIPALRVASVIVAGSDAKSLARAVGFIPGTALPGEGGNTGLAAHRDTFFRRLADIRVNDLVTVTTVTGSYDYLVQETQIVEPDDVWVLDPTPQPAVTLVTCYPFNYIGNAPRRFIVRATLRQ